MNEFWSWARSISWVGWVAIVAIICGFLITITKLILRHFEEMERIRHGQGSVDQESRKPPKPKA